MLDKNIKLTQFSSGAGWASKISAKELTQVLSKLNPITDHNSKGFESLDDCCIYKINDKQSIIQTVDFFTPIVDDPFTFGQIAAANSLSDIYAMGGKPLFALNVVAFPTQKLNLSILTDILNGGLDICKSINIPILGGHSIKDDVPKYGMCVTGIIDNHKILKNNTAKALDDIILTKPIGSGIITTALKKSIISSKQSKQTIEIMKTLNNTVQEIISDFKINACTDITGYGLLGHINEMAQSSKLTAEIHFDNIPIIDGVIELAKKDIIPGGSKKNFEFLKDKINFSSSLQLYEKFILADAQTSGGLLLSCSKDISDTIINKINNQSKFEAKIIGEFKPSVDVNIICKKWKKFI